MRYLGVYFVKSRTLKCSLDAAEQLIVFFGKVGRIASEEIVLHLTTSNVLQFYCMG